ncbi:hypothetical protein ACP4OV_017152 [Aristida adscensionis]
MICASFDHPRRTAASSIGSTILPYFGAASLQRLIIGST